MLNIDEPWDLRLLLLSDKLMFSMLQTLQHEWRALEEWGTFTD